MLEYGATQFEYETMWTFHEYKVYRTQLCGMNEDYIIFYDTMQQTLDNYENNYR